MGIFYANANLILFAVNFHFLKGSAIAVERGLAAGELLPAQDGYINVLRRDFERVAGAAGHFGGDDLRTAADERVVSNLAIARMISDQPQEQFDRLLRRVALIFPNRSSALIKRPHRILIALAVERRTATAHPSVKAQFVLPVIVTAAENEVRLRPNDLPVNQN